MTSERKQVSIKRGIAIMIVLGLLIPMTLTSGWGFYNDYTNQIKNYQDRMESISTILYFGVREAIWNYNQESAETLLQAFIDDKSIENIEIITGDGEVFAKLQRPEQEGQSAPPLKESQMIKATKLIEQEGEKIGEIQVTVSLIPLQTEIRNKVITLLASTLFQLLVCLGLIITMLSRKVVKKIATLEEQAGQIAEKKLGTPFEWDDNNEIGSLGRSLESTRVSLKQLFENLEQMVEERTETINIILNNVRSGFFILDQDLKVQDGFTKSCYQLLGEHIKVGLPVAEALGITGREADHYSCCLAQVFDDFLPEEVSFGQVPNRVHAGERVLSVEGSPIHNQSGQLVSILMTINDITALEQTEHENARNRAAIKILRQKDAFAHYVEDTRQLLEQSISQIEDYGQVKVNLHTIKGNSASFGLSDIAQLVHEIEEKPSFSQTDIKEIEATLKSYLQDNHHMLKIDYIPKDGQSNRSFEVSGTHLDKVDEQILSQDMSEELRKAIMKWVWDIKKKPAMEVFATVEGLVEPLAERLFKEVEFIFEGREVMIDADRMHRFVQVVPHIIRNCLDHGLEAPEDRGAKKPQGRITLRVADHDFYYWKVEVADDGKGINTDRLAEKALTKGLFSKEAIEAMSHEEKCKLIFTAELSTAKEVTDISGRGVGMDAVKRCVEDLDGHIEVHSTLGKGTEFSFLLAKKKETEATRRAAS